MQGFLSRLCLAVPPIVGLAAAFPQQVLTWQATRAQVFSDVDSAYAAVTSSVLLLQPYRDRDLRQASRVRDTIAFCYEHGAASLLDFLNAQADYRRVQNNYLSLVGSHLDAANQLNLAVGREVIP